MILWPRDSAAEAIVVVVLNKREPQCSRDVLSDDDAEPGGRDVGRQGIMTSGAAHVGSDHGHLRKGPVSSGWELLRMVGIGDMAGQVV